jgi:hypothetical protein
MLMSRMKPELLREECMALGEGEAWFASLKEYDIYSHRRLVLQRNTAGAGKGFVENHCGWLGRR